MSSKSFELLDSRIQHWIWSNGWAQMREAQELAIPLIINAENDVIIAAATAAGKTEAAFLPVLTHILRDGNENSLVVYISPLKALINDQFGRIEQLCETLDIAVWPWHGDISMSRKAKFFKDPGGVLLITPESLEAMFVNRGSQLEHIFSGTKFIVIDELHAFIGTERGKQLQSIMHRLDLAIKRSVPRIGLSATIGEISIGAEFLRPGAAADVALVQTGANGNTLKVQLRAYIEPIPTKEHSDDAEQMIAKVGIASHIFETSRGKNNLIFPNSRSEVENYTNLLKSFCEKLGVPVEYWPHHGNLSKHAREETELALKDKTKPNSAVCTSTLELGIDIGEIDTVYQIGAPPSVASLRQRLGRSGRREGTSAILRAYTVVQETDAKSSIPTLLREDLFHFTAVISLLLENWFEPPNPNGAHLSTMVQQLLSMIAQYGGISASKAYNDLVVTGPFKAISKSEFVMLLRHLGEQQLLEQDSSGLLLIGKVGEVQVNHYSFYSAFQTEAEFRLYCGTEMLGTIPVTTILFVGQIIIFSGRNWQIFSIDEDDKVIQVQRYKGGLAPVFISNRPQTTHSRIRQKMKELYQTNDVPLFLDKNAVVHLEQGRKAFSRYCLLENCLLQEGAFIYLATWLGDNVNLTLAALLRKNGLIAENRGLFVEVHLSNGQTIDDLHLALHNLIKSEKATVQDILNDAQALRMEKWDWTLPDELLMKSFASLRLEIDSTYQWIHQHFHQEMSR